MTINRAQTRLYVASDNSDTVVVVDTGADRIVEEIRTTAPHALFPGLDSFKGAAPNNVALSPDEGTLFVTNGGTNSVAVIQLCHALQQPEQDDDDGDNGDDDGLDDTGCNRQQASRVIGLIPTGWYPNAVSVSPDGSILYTVNGKTNAGPNPRGCRASLSIAAGSMDVCRSANQYIWQLEKAGLQSMPMPDAAQLAGLTRQVAYNNNFPGAVNYARESATLAFLRERIRHVIYVVKENRTYDQILGDLEVGNGDPELAILAPYSPNHKKLARSFVTLDNFYDSGEASSTGWNWTTAARTTDFTEKTAPVNYAGRGLTRDWEGLNRNIYVSAPTPAERKIPNPASPDDPDILAGTADVAAPDGPGGEAGAGYLWDAALRAGLSVRNYGFYGGMKRYSLPASDPGFIPLTATPYADNSVQFFARKQSLTKISDPYFRGYDMKYPDYWRFQEWEREFDEFAARGELPNLMLVRLSHDHFGDFSRAAAGVDTVETQMADNDYALGLLVEKVAHSVFRDDTLIFIIEDDAQNGGDHVDAHRSIGYVIGPYVRQGAVVSTHYTTVSMLRTMEEVLGLPPLGINDGLTAPMVDVFDRNQHDWDYRAVLPQVLLSTDLVLRYDPDTIVAAGPAADCGSQPLRSAEYWQRSMSGQNFSVEDELDTPRFNQALWAGFKGDAMPVPTVRHGRDLSSDRARLLQDYAEKRNRECHSLRALR
jgi:DNA-binding beta-propeller fold protein YncE